MIARRERLASEGADDAQSSKQKRESLASMLFEKRALVGALPMLIICLGFAIPTSYTALYAESLGFPNAGLFFLIGAIAMTATRFLGGRLLDVVPPRLLYLITVACGIVMFLLMAFAQDAGWLYISGIFFGISMGFSFPLLNSMSIKNTPPERWGAANAMFYLANDLGVGVGAFAWGVLIDAAGFFPAMIGGVVAFALSYLVALAIFPRKTDSI